MIQSNFAHKVIFNNGIKPLYRKSTSTFILKLSEGNVDWYIICSNSLSILTQKHFISDPRT